MSTVVDAAAEETIRSVAASARNDAAVIIQGFDGTTDPKVWHAAAAGGGGRYLLGLVAPPPPPAPPYIGLGCWC